MENRTTTERPRFYTQTDNPDLGYDVFRRVGGCGVRVARVDPGNDVDEVVAALNAHAERKDASSDRPCSECGLMFGRLVHAMCPRCINEYEARVDRDNDDDREREIAERR